MNVLDRAAAVADEQEFWRSGIASILRRNLAFRSVTQVSTYHDLVQSLGTDAPPTFVVADLGLPQMQSFGGLRALRERFPSICLVVISEREDKDTILQTLASGSHGFIPKRLQADEVLAALTAIIKGGVFVPPEFPDLPDGPAGDTTDPISSSVYASLTPRQREVSRLLANGKSNREIAEILGITEGTVKVHVNAVFREFGVHNRVSAAIVLRSER